MAALNRLSHVLEKSERQYQELIGDPHINPGYRHLYSIGQLLHQINKHEALCCRIHERWTYNNQVQMLI